MNLNLIVFDMDGTLLDSNYNMPSENINYLKKLKDKGYVTAIATGRTILSAYDRLNNIPCVNYIIPDNGSKIYDVDKGVFIHNLLISKSIVSSIIDLFDETFKYIEICSNGKGYRYSKTTDKTGEFIKNYNDKQKLIDDIDEVDHIEISFINNECTFKMYEYMSSKYKDLDILILQDSFSNQKWIGILPIGAGKFKAIKKLADYLNVPIEKVMAFGDGLNDVEMIEKCGVGVALSNALKEVKDHADYITNKSNKDLGVIDFLKEYLNEQ